MYRLYTKQMYETPAPFYGLYVLFKDFKLTHVYHDIQCITYPMTENSSIFIP